MSGNKTVALTAVIVATLMVLTTTRVSEAVTIFCMRDCVFECMNMKVFTPQECKQECIWACVEAARQMGQII